MPKQRGTAAAAAEQQTEVPFRLGPLYENVIATVDPAWALRYWAELGYRPVAEGRLPAEAAEHLYGWESDLTGIRLQNGGSSAHGLVRLLVWHEGLQDDGNEQEPFMRVGSRWFAARTDDIYQVYDAYSDGAQHGEMWLPVPPQRSSIGVSGGGTGFFDRFVGVREFTVAGLETRHAFFQRYNDERPGSGTIAAGTPLRTSEGTASSVVVEDGEVARRFYVEGMGLTALGRKEGPASRESAFILHTLEGQRFTMEQFQSGRSDVGVLQVYQPLFLAEGTGQTRAGSRGLCAFSYRVDDVGRAAEHLAAHGAAVGPMSENELGELSVCFVSPDDVFWMLVEGLPAT